MAVDTRLKRASAINIMCPWRGLYPAPDSTIAAADRLISAWLYAGIAATSDVIEEVIVAVRRMRRRMPGMINRM